MSNNIIKFPQKSIITPQKISGGISKEQVFKNEQLRVSVQLIINPNDNDISEMPLIKQIRFFISQVERSIGVKLTNAGYLPPVIVKELYHQKILKDYLIEHGITKLTKETDCNIIVLTRILCEMSGLIKKRNGILTVTKKHQVSWIIINYCLLYFLRSRKNFLGHFLMVIKMNLLVSLDGGIVSS